MGGPSGGPRLPTRCPSCKGAVIQRISARSHGSVVWFQCFFCNHAWKFRLHDLPTNPDGEVAGDLFVPAADGKRHAFGSVVLNAIPEQALKEHLERKTTQRAFELEKLQREIDALAPKVEEARAEESRLWSIQNRDQSDLQKASAWSRVYNTTKDLVGQLDDLHARREQLTSPEYFFASMPAPVSSARTDAQGTFTLPMPRDGRYGIVARASREVGERKETYFWFVWVSLDGASSKRLALSNDNMVGAGSPDSALG